MSEPTTLDSNIRFLTFAEAKRPVFKEYRRGKFVQFGEDNLYPEYLLELFHTAAKHGSIVGGKAVYVAGKGWKTKDGAADPVADAFIKRANRYNEGLGDVLTKVALDGEIFYGAYLQCIWSNAGTRLAEVYHLDFSKVRTNKDNTQFFYCEDWKAARTQDIKVFPAYNPANPHGSQVLFIKFYSPASGAYPQPDYLRALNYISAEVEVGAHTLSNAKTGFSASKAITLLDGDPSDDEKKKITKKFEGAFTGAPGRRFILNFVTSAERKPIIDDLGASTLTKEDFTAVDTLIQTNIFTAHKITTPALFGIATPGALGQRTELRDGYEIFRNTYVNAKQQTLEAHFNLLAKAAGVTAELEIIPTDPIDFELDNATIAANMTPDEIRAKAGLTATVAAEKTGAQVLNEAITSLSPLVANKVLDSLTINEIRALASLPPQAGGDTVPVPAGMVPAGSEAEAEQLGAETNPLLRDITGRQWQGIKRIIREVGSGKTSDAVARMMLGSAYGLSDEQISVLLGTPAAGDELALSEQESEDDRAIAVFAQFGMTREGVTVLKSKRVKYADDADAEVREHGYLAFAGGKLSELQASILDLISKDKRITPEVLAETLGADLTEVSDALADLTKSGALKVKGDERTLNKSLAELLEGVKAKTKAFRVMYSYDGPQDSRNRPFCAKLMELGRYYSRVDIESISARLGYSAWDRRGGFYHNPKTGETTPYCRHTWMSHIVMTNK